MKDNHLLVPINVEALVVPETGIPNSRWIDLKPNFAAVLDKRLKNRKFLGKDLEVKIGHSQENLHKPGIHLHWALPDGLTHGVTRNDGDQPKFPIIPNRWLILRFWDQSRENEKFNLGYKAWIVESDTVTDDPGAAVWPTLTTAKLQKKEDYYVFVGRHWEMSKWPGETPADRVNVTAVGYGDPAFAAYYPACKGILGFCDDKDLEDLEDATLTYGVLGWYSDPSQDPLQQSSVKKIDGELAVKLEQLRELADFLGTELSARMEGFFKLDDFLARTQWIYPEFDEAQTRVNEAEDLALDLKNTNETMALFEKAQKEKKIDNSSAIAELEKKIAALKEELQSCSAANEDFRRTFPAHLLCHGIITGIQWKKKPDGGVPRGKPHQISVGNTAVDALAALFAKQCGAEFAKLLSVFQYDLLSELEKPGGDTTLDFKVHERSFARFSRGIRWDLLQDTRPGFSAIQEDRAQPMEDRAPPIPGDVRTLLEQLNMSQRLINQRKRELESLMSELYATWYKKVLNTQARGEKADEEKLIHRLTKLQEDIERAAADIAAWEVADEKEKPPNNERPKGAEWEEIKRQLEVLLPGWNLQAFDEPEFWRPNDPMVLMAGEAFQRSQRHGEDGRYRSDGRLLCRLSGQEITRIKVKIPYAKDNSDVEFGGADIDHWGASFPSLGDLPVPKEAIDLFRESLLLTLDSKRAREIVAAAYEKNDPGKEHSEEIKKVSDELLSYLKKVWEVVREADSETPILRYPETDQVDRASFELVGTFPSPIIINRWGKNPWLPLYIQWQVSWVPSYSDVAHVLDGWKIEGSDFERDGNDAVNKGQNGVETYSGTSLLTPSAVLLFSDRLRQYNLMHDNAKLRTFQTNVSSMNVLCQSLGGLTEQFLMRKRLLELHPLEPGSGNAPPQFSPIYDAVKDVDWLSPLTDGSFLPVRSGHLKLEKLWIIDAFGQCLMLEDLKEEEKRREGTLFNPLLPEQLRGPDGSVRLAPRLAQPARFTIQWPAADRRDAPGEKIRPLGKDDEFNPVCGWILPNFLDEGLMIYDAKGYALGSLQIVLRKSWRDGVGSVQEEIESFHWVDLPGSDTFFFGKPPKTITDPLGEKANAHLRAFVNGLLSLTEGCGQAFMEIVEKMNEAFSSAGGAGSSHNPNLALLIGRPLALVRACLRLEVDGRLACDQGWDAVQGEKTGGIEKVKFPIRMGDCRPWKGALLGDDGLVGFFLQQDYTQFYTAFGLKERADDKYNKYNFMPQLSIDEPADLTLLMDPSRGICVTSGILPRTIFHLPYGDIVETLENKQVVFFTGPVVSPESDKDIQMPQPSDVYGQWSWTHHPEVKVWRKNGSIVDVQKEQGRFSETPLQIAEGWLKLITAPLAIRAFTVKGQNPMIEEIEAESAAKPVKPERFEVTPAPDGKIILSWSVTGAEKIELLREELSLFESHRHPLPTQYAIEVDRSTSFTLIASDRVGKAALREIIVQIT